MSPETFGDYDLEDALGRGAMGVVRRARHRETGAVVALKTVHVADPVQLSNLRAEVAALARLSHPGLATIVDHGTHEGSPFVAMELVEGESLKSVFERQPLTDVGEPIDPAWMAQVLAIFADLARTLAYVHGEGIVHRDLKPGNVLVRPDGRPVLVDFGLARRRSAGARESLDAQRGAIGTALYMSPEQIMRQLVDARADLYALGAMLHEALSGCPPFLGADASAVLAKHVAEPPLRLSTLVAAVPASLEQLVAGLLEKDRHARVPYALDVVDALVAAGASPEPMKGAPAPRPYVYDAELQGRDEPIRRVADAFTHLAAGRGAAIAVVGESGAGKTRFVAEAIEGIPYDHLLAAGTCETVVGDPHGDASGTRALVGLRPLLRTTADLLRAAPHQADALLGEDGALLALYEPELLSFVDPARAAPLPSAAELEERLVSAITSLVRRHSTAGPVVVVIDDLQWADGVTLRWARAALGGALFDVPVAVVVSARAENRVDLGAMHDRSARVELAPLDDRSMLEITRQMLGARTIERELATLVGAAQGNPFALASAIRTAAEEGSLVRESRARWHLARAAALADRLRESGTHVAVSMARLRLRALTPDARWVATALSAMGSGSTLEDVIAVAFGGDAERAGMAAFEAIRRGVVQHARDGSLAVAHDKLREAAYELASATERVRLHGAAALRIATSRPPTAEALAMIARHRDLAGDAAGAAHAELEASAAYEARGAANEARLHAEAAVAVAARVAPDEPVRRRADVRLGGLLVSLGGVPRAMPLLERARASAEVAGDVATLAAAHVHLGYASYLKGELEAMFTHAGAGAEAAARAGDQRLLARAENALGIAWGSSGRFRRAIEHYSRAAAIARDLGDVAQVGRFASNISINHRLLGELDEAERCAREALDATRAAPTMHANAWSNLGRILFEADRVGEAEEAFERAHAIATRIGNAVVSSEATWGLSLAALAKGEPDLASERAEQSLAIARAAEMATGEALALRALGWIDALTGDGAALARAEARIGQSLAILETAPERDELADGLRARAFIRARAGRQAESAQDLAAARAIYDELGMSGRLAALDAPMASWACF